MHLPDLMSISKKWQRKVQKSKFLRGKNWCESRLNSDKSWTWWIIWFFFYLYGTLIFFWNQRTHVFVFNTSIRNTMWLLCYYAFFQVCCGCDTSYIVSVHIQCQASIYTLSLCRGHSWRVRLAKQETLTPPGHLVSPLVCRGPWMSTVVLYCWCHSDSASVLLYFTL